MQKYVLVVEYDKYLRRYRQAQSEHDKIVQEMERLFARTQPHPADLEKDRVTGGNQDNAFDAYMIEKERLRLDERLRVSAQIIAERKYLLGEKEKELRASMDNHIIIWRMVNMDHSRIKKVMRRTHYSESQVFRILQAIRTAVEDARKCE